MLENKKQTSFWAFFGLPFAMNIFGKSKKLTEKVNDSLKEDSLLQMIEILTNVLWPNGVFIKDVPPPNRSIDQQLSTQIEARTLLLQHIPASIQSMTGHYNARR